MEVPEVLPRKCRDSFSLWATKQILLVTYILYCLTLSSLFGTKTSVADSVHERVDSRVNVSESNVFQTETERSPRMKSNLIMIDRRDDRVILNLSSPATQV